MANLSITRNYADGEVLLEADLDEVCDDLETFLNKTKINDDNIQPSGITGSTKLLDGSVSAAKLASDAVTTVKIADDAVTAAKVADGAIDDAAKLASSVVTTAKLATDAVTTVKITDANVTAAKLASDAVTTAKILDANVTTAKLADGAVTPAKRSTALYGQTAVTSVTTSASHALTFTGTARPVVITLTCHGYNFDDPSTWSCATAGAELSVYKNNVKLEIICADNNTDSAFPAPTFFFIDTAGYAGSLTYDLRSSAGTITPDSTNRRHYFSVYEL